MIYWVISISVIYWGYDWRHQKFKSSYGAQYLKAFWRAAKFKRTSILAFHPHWNKAAIAKTRTYDQKWQHGHINDAAVVGFRSVPTNLVFSKAFLFALWSQWNWHGWGANPRAHTRQQMRHTQPNGARHEPCALQSSKDPQFGHHKWSRNKILRTQCVTPSFSIQEFWPAMKKATIVLTTGPNASPQMPRAHETHRRTRHMSFPQLSATLSTNGRRSGAGADEASSTVLQWSAAQLMKGRAPDMQMGYSQMDVYEKELMWWLPKTASWERFALI